MQAPPQQPVPAPQGSPPPHLHSPSTQVSPAAQAGVHSGSWHTPETQVSPASVSQATPQAPQCSVEVVSAAQVPPQQVSPAAQVSPVPHRHDPPAQVFPIGGHIMLQAPQLNWSFSVLTHTSPQQVVPPVQGVSGPHC